MPRKSHMLRSLVRHFLTRSRKIGTRGSGLSLAGGMRRRIRRVGGSRRRGATNYGSVVPVNNIVSSAPISKSFFSRHKGKLAAALGLTGAALIHNRSANGLLPALGYAAGRTYGRIKYGSGRRRHTGGALRLAGQHGSIHSPVHVGVSKMGLTNLPQAY